MKFNIGKLRKNAIVVLASLSMAATNSQAFRFTSFNTLLGPLGIVFKGVSGGASIIAATELKNDGESENYSIPLYALGSANICGAIKDIPSTVQSWQTNTLLNDSDKKKEMEKKFGNSQPGMYPGNTSMPSPYMQNPMVQSNMNMGNFGAQSMGYPGQNMNMGTYSMPGYGAQNNAGNPGALNPNGTFRR